MKKLLTLFTLLLTVCSGAWGDDITLYSYVDGTETNEEAMTIVGSNVSKGYTGQKYNAGSTTPTGTITFPNSIIANNEIANAIKLEIDGGFKTGDKISFVAYYNNSKTKKANLDLYYDKDTKIAGLTNDNIINARNVAGTPDAIEYTLEDDYDVLYIGRRNEDDATRVNILKIYVTRTPAPTGAYTITKGEHNNGNFTISPSSADENDVITLSATPNDGYVFNSWRIFKTGDTNTPVTPTSGDANTTFTMPAYDVTVDARFVAQEYVITHTAAEHGTYTIQVASEAPVSGNTVGYIGQTVYLVATPEDGYTLSAWNVTKNPGGEAVTMKSANAFDMPAAGVTIAPTFVAAVAPTISVNATSLSTPQNVSVGLTATATGSPNPTITWYQSATAVASGGTEIATGTSYSPAVTTIGTYYFYAVASNGVDPDAVSDVITFTVAPKLNSLVYSNGFKAFIQQPGAGNGKIKAYYIAGTDAPTVSSFTATTGATYNVEDNTLTLTAADGETTAVYDITLDPVTPYSGTGEYTFTADDSWVKAGNSFSTGWKIARSYESDSEKKFMISTGSNRLYLFLAPSTSLTITQNGTERDMLVSIDGGAAVEKEAAETFTVTGKDNAAYMVEISQKNSGGGDGKISKVNITKTGFESGIITASGWNTFSSNYALDLSTISGGTAYVATTVDNTVVTMTKTTAKIAAGTGIMINGSPNAAFTIGVTPSAPLLEANNQLEGLPNGGTVAVAGEGYNYVFGWTDPADPGFYLIDSDQPTLGANKAYLHTTTALSGKLNIIIDDSTSQEEETDGIKAVSTKVENGVRYNLAGQKVGADYKGIVIVNGKKMLNK